LKETWVGHGVWLGAGQVTATECERVMEEPGFGWSLKEDGTEGFQPTTVQLTIF